MTFVGEMNSANAARARRAGYAARPARVEDAQRIAEVHVQSWREAYPSLMPPEYLARLDVEEFTDRWRTWLRSPVSEVVVHLVGVHPNGSIVAVDSAGLNRDPDPPTEWELWAINLLASQHGTGLADLMMGELVSVGPCSLWVLPGNARAVAFYARHGFRADGRTKAHLLTGTIETRMVRD